MMTFRLTGHSFMISKLLRIEKKFIGETTAAADAEMAIEMNESANKAPYLTGALRDSKRQIPASWSDRKLTAGFTFGNDVVDYAAAVHEDLEAIHTTGEAKFAESTLRESSRHMARRIGVRIRLSGIV